MSTQPHADTGIRRSTFVGRVQQQRQFQVVLRGLLAHHQAWRQWADEIGPDFDPDQAPSDDSYARVFVLHGIGGIGKSWLARRCLELARKAESDPTILTLYEDIPLGPPVLEETHLMRRIHDQLVQAGYKEEMAAYRRTQIEAPRVAERVARYQAENRERWDGLVQTASALIAEGVQVLGWAHGLPMGETFTKFAQITISEVGHSGAAVIAKAYDLLMERMQQEGQLEAEEIPLFRDPLAAQAGKLVSGLKQIALERPLVVALDTLEAAVPLEPFLRDYLVLPSTDAPMLWILSGRHNLADERMVELQGEKQPYKGYRDLLGQNPPVVWDVSTFSDADVREYLEAEAERRRVTLEVDDALITTVKETSGGVPLALEMVADAIFNLGQQQFLRDFTLHDKSLLPAERLEQVTSRFLRYCLARKGGVEDLERVQGMALLRRDADEHALRAVWELPKEQRVRDVLHDMQVRYGFVRADGLHDVVYEFVRRELLTLPNQSEARAMLSARAVEHYRSRWEGEHSIPDDPAVRTRDPRWQEATHDLLNVLLWADPDRAVQFLLPRFVEGLGFDFAFAVGLVRQAAEFLQDNTFPLRRADADRLRRLCSGLQDVAREGPGDAVGPMVELLLKSSGLEPVHLSILHLWQGHWLAGAKRHSEALAAYLEAKRHLPGDAAGLQGQLRNAFVFLGVGLRRLGQWKESEAACWRAMELDPKDALAWNGLGLAYRRLERWEEAEDAYRKAIGLDPKLAYPHNNLGCLYLQQGRLEEAKEEFSKCIDLLPDQALEAEVLLAVIACHQGEAQLACSHFERGLGIWDKAWQSGLESPFDLLACKALALLGVGRPQEAIVALRQALEERPPGYTLEFHTHDLLITAPQPLDGLDDMVALLREAAGQ